MTVRPMDMRSGPVLALLFTSYVMAKAIQRRKTYGRSIVRLLYARHFIYTLFLQKPFKIGKLLTV